MRNIVKIALAGAMVAEASASQSAAELIAEAMTKVEVGSAVHEHLSNAAAAVTKNDAATLEGHSQLVSVPIDDGRHYKFETARSMHQSWSFRSEDMAVAEPSRWLPQMLPGPRRKF